MWWAQVDTEHIYTLHGVIRQHNAEAWFIEYFYIWMSEINKKRSSISGYEMNYL